jgi:hypothetical protein
MTAARRGWGETALPLGAAFAFAALSWIINTPYVGIVHDAIIYALLAARFLDPGAYGRELFLAYGGQDAFSIFAPIYGGLVGQLGLDAAARLTVAAGGLLWVGGCLLLARATFGRIWLVALATVVCAGLKWSYSPNFATFAYNESFATARSIGLPLGVFALAALVAGRRCWFWALSLAATAVHPLHGIWLPLLELARRLTARQLAASLALGGAALAAGAALSFGPLQAMAPDWAATVRASSVDVFSGGWEHLRFGEIFLAVGVLWLGGRLGSPALRELYLRLSWLTAWALLLFVVCSEFMPVKLVMQVQPWRVLWLSQLLAVLAACDLLGVAVARGRAEAALAFCLLAVAWSAPGLRPALPFLLVALHATPARDRLVEPLLALLRRPRLPAALVAVLVLILLPSYWRSLGIAGHAVTASFWPGQPELRGFVLAGGEGLGFLLLAAILRWRAAAGVVLLLALPALLWEAGRWDHRPAAQKALEAMYLPAGGGRPWPSLPIGRNEIVAWQPFGVEVWTVLGNPAYAMHRQATGIVFSEARTAEIRRRLLRLDEAVHGGSATAGRAPHDLNALGKGAVSAAGAAYLCQDPVLDRIIVPHAAVGMSTGTRFDAGPLLGGPQFIHDCRTVRANVARRG